MTDMLHADDVTDMKSADGCVLSSLRVDECCGEYYKKYEKCDSSFLGHSGWIGSSNQHLQLYTVGRDSRKMEATDLVSYWNADGTQLLFWRGLIHPRFSCGELVLRFGVA
jgi:hypothetical protein